MNIVIKKENTFKKIVVLALILILSMLIIGCSEQSDTKTKKEVKVNQVAPPEKGEEVIEMVVKDFGVIKIRLFKEVAPKAVENFITHAKNGYYDGLTFHRVMNDFMIQGGDPLGTGQGGESIYKEAFEDEFSNQLLPVKGALCMANSGPNTNGSQFFIVQTNKVNLSFYNKLTSMGVSEELKKFYFENGGTDWLYEKHTVFGMVYEGIEIVDKIAAVEVDSQDMPNEKVIIEKINVLKY